MSKEIQGPFKGPSTNVGPTGPTGSKTMRCPECGEGTTREIVIPEHKAKLYRKNFIVKNAKVWECDTCKKQSVHNVELKRWEGILQETLVEQGYIPSKKVIKETREHFKLTIDEVARLFTVTTICACSWEDEKANPIPLGPVAVLWRLLVMEKEGKVSGILDILKKEADDRSRD